MPPDCEINWGKHRLSIKDRNVFGKMFNSSSKHHTGNMKIFLLVVACFAVALAAPSEKRKRDILPGDPRYGTDYHINHHHHENEVDISKAIGGYVGSYSAPETSIHENSFQLQKSYGPPNYQPGVPVNTDFTQTHISKETVPVPTYGIPETPVHIPPLNKKYLEPVIEEAKTQVPSASYGVPVHDVKTSVRTHTVKTELNAPSAEAPISSYGTPLVDDVKTITEPTYEDSNTQSTHTRNTIHKTIKTEVHEQKILEATKPEVKATKHVPESQGVTRYTVVEKVPHATIPNLHHEYTTSAVKYPESFPHTPISPLPTGGVYDHYGLGQHHEVLPSLPLKSYEHIPQLHVPQNYPIHHNSYPIHTLPYAFPYQHFGEISRPYFIQVPQTIPLEYPHTVPYVQPLPPVVKVKVPVHHEPVEKIETPHHYFHTSAHVQPVLKEAHKIEHLFKPTTEKPVHIPHHVKDVHGGSTDKESVTIDNPTANTEKIQSYTPITPTKEYVQPTDSNGGYVY